MWIGFDRREADAFAVARYSARQNCALRCIPIKGLVLPDLQKRGLYTRPTEYKPSAVDRPILWDKISDAPMSTEFALTRFLVPHLAGRGWAMFMDCDVLVRGDVGKLFEELDPTKALYCVKHDYEPSRKTKMDGQIQTNYKRKNWSSVMIFNCDHPANKALTLDLINTARGLELHKMIWLADCDIGELDPAWNYLVGEQEAPENPKIVHFTNGGPWMRGYDDVPYSDEWREYQNRWAA